MPSFTAGVSLYEAYRVAYPILCKLKRGNVIRTRRYERILNELGGAHPSWCCGDPASCCACRAYNNGELSRW